MDFQEYADSAESRFHFSNIKKPAIIGLAAIALIAIAVVMFSVSNSTQAGGFEVSKENAQPETSESSQPSDEVQTICVHVGGSVNVPGVCYLKEGARVADAIDAAGGMTAKAASESLNLARVVNDGEQIIVASKKEIAEQRSSAPSKEAAASSMASGTTGGTAGVLGDSGSADGSSSSSSGKVNINTATSEQLQTLSGIGESKAKKIISYREQNGPFKSVEDLTNVSGIGDKTLESLRNSICI